jgi:hypothetical protein
VSAPAELKSFSRGQISRLTPAYPLEKRQKMATQPTSQNWRIAFRGSASVQAGPGIGIAWFLIGHQEQSFSWPVLFVFGPGLALSVGAVPYSYCDFVNFTTASALGPSNFSVPLASNDDSSDLAGAVADATNTYLQNNTDPSYVA